MSYNMITYDLDNCRMKYRKYKELYKKSLKLSPDHESIKSKLKELEEGLDVCNIVIAREQAKAEV